MLSYLIRLTLIFFSLIITVCLTHSICIQKWEDWKVKDNCQPNYRSNVTPDPKKQCGPYTPVAPTKSPTEYKDSHLKVTESNHDTIGMICINKDGRIAAATSTNGLTHKVPG